MRLIHLIPLVFVLLEACVDPLKMDALDGTPKFVVEGLITNNPGPYEVKLYYSISLENRLKKTPVEAGASVWIFDNTTVSEKLSEVSPGIYQTNKNGMQGVVGHEYYVRIRTKFGREYQSTPQRLEAAGEITSVDFEFEPNGLAIFDPEKHVDALKILLDSKGNEKGDNLFRWRWTTIFEARTFPELRLDYPLPPAAPVLAPAPEPCSGYVRSGPITFPYPDIMKVGECTCCVCWPYTYSPTSLISHNRIIDGTNFEAVDLGKIPATANQFYTRYYIKVEQLSLSEDAYDFWNLIEKQESGQGSLFQPNSVKVRGNIQCITDPTEEVLGLFGVSGVATKELFLSPDLVPHKLVLQDTMKHACGEVYKDSYSVKPSFW